MYIFSSVQAAQDCIMIAKIIEYFFSHLMQFLLDNKRIENKLHNSKICA